MIQLNENKQSCEYESIPWSRQEREAFVEREIIPTADWVEKYVSLPVKDTAVPGPVNLDMTPYLRVVMGWVDDPEVDRITMRFGTQLGKSSLLKWTLMSMMDQRPGGYLWVLPRDADARDEAGGAFKRVVLDCPQIVALLPRGEYSLTKEGYTFTTGTLNFGSAESAASLSRKACRGTFGDEAAKYSKYVGDEGNPIDLMRTRMRTYENTIGCLQIIASSPIFENDVFGQLCATSQMHYWWVPCPKCGRFQQMAFSSFIMARRKDSQGKTHRFTIEEYDNDESLVWYECIYCKAHWDDALRTEAIRGGLAVPGGQTVDVKGIITGTPEKPNSRHKGLHMPSWCSPFIKQNQLMAKFLESLADPSKKQAFDNQERAEYWKEKSDRVPIEELRKHQGKYLMGTAPRGVQVIQTAIDRQLNYFVVETSGWGYGMERWVLDFRDIQTPNELLFYLKTMTFPRVESDGTAMDTEKYPPLGIWKSFIDVRFQLWESYKMIQHFTAQGFENIKPCQGMPGFDRMPKWWTTAISKDSRTNKAYRYHMLLHRFESRFFKDGASVSLKHQTPGPGYVHLPADISEKFFKHMDSEIRVVKTRKNKKRTTGKDEGIWEEKSSAWPNHGWDDFVMGLMGAEASGFRNLQNPDEPPPPVPKRRVGMKQRRGDFRRKY